MRVGLLIRSMHGDMPRKRTKGRRDEGTRPIKMQLLSLAKDDQETGNTTARVSIGRYLYLVASAQLPIFTPHYRSVIYIGSRPRDYYNNRYGIRTALAKGKGRRTKLTEKQNQSTIHWQGTCTNFIEAPSAPRFQIPLSRP